MRDIPSSVHPTRPWSHVIQAFFPYVLSLQCVLPSISSVLSPCRSPPSCSPSFYLLERECERKHSIRERERGRERERDRDREREKEKETEKEKEKEREKDKEKEKEKKTEKEKEKKREKEK